jgi:hypothetical protein
LFLLQHVREHVASLLPFKVIESVAGKPLRIVGVAMAAGMSRNFNVYTPEELQFTLNMWLLIQLLEKLRSAPMTQFQGACCMRLKFTTQVVFSIFFLCCL